MRVLIRTPVRPTEDRALVEQAVLRLFPDAALAGPGAGAADGDAVDATSTRLDPLRTRVWELRIIDTVRGKLLHGIATDGRSLAVRLSKQAALQGKVSFPPTPHALGDLEVQVTLEPGDPWPDAEALCWWLCPETKDGEIVGPTA